MSYLVALLAFKSRSYFKSIAEQNMAHKGDYKLQLQDPDDSHTRQKKATCFRVFVCFAVLGLSIGVAVFIAGIVILNKSSTSQCPNKLESRSSCGFSPEARRVGLPDVLRKIKEAYYEYNPNYVAWKPDLFGKELNEFVKKSYRPYDPHPTKLKAKTDKSLGLLEDVKSMNPNKDLLTPRESKAVAQASHFLQHNFGTPYDENYYAGDWMLGPNYFCWQPICNLAYELRSYGMHAMPRTINDVQQVIDAIISHRNTFERYRANMELGVRTGMVRSVVDCKSSVYAFKNNYGNMAIKNDSSAIFEESYARVFLETSFLSRLEEGVEQSWVASKGLSVQDSLRRALVSGFAQPLLELVHYMEFQHVRHCPPDKVSSGLSELPLDYVYVDGVPDVSQVTNKTLPTGERVDGKKTYKTILSFFTTSDITPEQVYEEGVKQLDIFMPQVLSIAKEITGISNQTNAVRVFQEKLNEPAQWHNDRTFPENESNAQAYKTCVDHQSAEKYCPVRWAAMVKWTRYIQYVMGLISPKLPPLFYFTGPKATAANCPVEMEPHYNPSNGAMYFKPSNAFCTVPSYFGMPFFLKQYGPKFQEWSVTGHEARPGHHTQMQGLLENYEGSCDDDPEWLNKQNYYIAFQEGWALYAENPLLSRDVNLYQSNLLQKYGMLKWQS
ncbi:uncharacterized protein LOC116293574 [Actinia tenebrosa]|uniref:Uncharacterized protein LOC116293574 n=1 Tax=Actinia tenebrosa TaxID=6105 RepID=A0A6P8HW60_ACTTE|nr:uncharacterized protein LOC116293574 [Actinia tenebrosa]